MGLVHPAQHGEFDQFEQAEIDSISETSRGLDYCEKQSNAEIHHEGHEATKSNLFDRADRVASSNKFHLKKQFRESRTADGRGETETASCLRALRGETLDFSAEARPRDRADRHHNRQ